MKRAQAALLVILALASQGAWAARDKKPEPKKPASETKPAPGVTVVEGTGWKRTEIRVEGTVVGLAAPKRAGGRRDLAILTKPAADEKTREESCPAKPFNEDDPAPGGVPQNLFFWRSDAPETVTRLAEPVAPWTVLAAADAEGDPGEEVLVLGARRMSVLRSDNGALSLATLLEDRALGLVTQEPRGIFPDLAVAGALRRYGRDASGAWGVRGTLPMPVEATYNGDRLQLSSPGVTRVADTGPLATRPEAVGTERLRSWLIDGAPEARSVSECWMRFPSSERLIDRQYMVLDGKPVLLVATMTAEKLSLFGEKALRLYPLHADRTRSGAKPLFAATSQMNIWQPMHAGFRDADGDGREDLAIAYWKGLKDSTLMTDVYLRSPDGAFQSRARSQSFDVEDADKGFLAMDHDLTGDGVPDALVRVKGKVCVHAGVAKPSSPGAILSKTPSVCAELPGDLVNMTSSVSVSFGTEGAQAEFTGDQQMTAPLIVDLDGDGRSEVLLAFAGLAGPGVAVYRLTTP